MFGPVPLGVRKSCLICPRSLKCKCLKKAVLESDSCGAGWSLIENCCRNQLMCQFQH